MTFGEPAWIDTIIGRIGDRLVAGAGLAADLVFAYEGDPGDLLGKPPGNKFLVLAPMRLETSLPIVAGGGASHTVFPSLLRVDVCQQVGGNQEFHSYRTFRAAGGLAATVRSVVNSLQLATLANAEGTTTPLVEPMRLVGCEFNPRMPAAGWSWCRTVWSVKWRSNIGS